MKTMKMFAVPALRVAVLAMCTGVLGSAALMAQDTPPPPPPAGQQGGGPGGYGGRGNPAEMQAKQLERMTKVLNLTPDQVTQIKAIQDDGRTQGMALRNDTSLSGPDKRAKMMAMREAEMGKVRAVLTDDQKPKYDAMLAKEKERREEHREGQAPPPPPAPPQQ